LFAGGRFTIAGTTPAEGIAKWDGANWAALGSGIDISYFSTCRVTALADYDDGGGARLFATGQFFVAGGTPASEIASWDGTAWSAAPKPGMSARWGAALAQAREEMTGIAKHLVEVDPAQNAGNH
jgi:hypothetical protein